MLQFPHLKNENSNLAAVQGYVEGLFFSVSKALQVCRAVAWRESLGGT